MPSFRLHYPERWRVRQLLIWSFLAFTPHFAQFSAIQWTSLFIFFREFDWQFYVANFMHCLLRISFYFLTFYVTCISHRDHPFWKMFKFNSSQTQSSANKLLIKFGISRSVYDARVHYQINCGDHLKNPVFNLPIYLLSNRQQWFRGFQVWIFTTKFSLNECQFALYTFDGPFSR